MRFSEEDKKNAGQLSEAAVKWLEYVERQPEYLSEKTFRDAGLPKRCDDVNVWPTFISPQLRQEFSDAASAAHELTQSIPRRIFNLSPQRLGAYYSIDPRWFTHIQFEANPAFLNEMVARIDLQLTPDQQIKCLECNTVANVGGCDFEIGTERMRRHPIIRRFRDEYQLKVREFHQLNEFMDHIFCWINKIDMLKFRNQEEINILVAMDPPEAGMNCPRHLALFNRSYRLVSRERHDGRFKGAVAFSVGPHPGFAIRQGKLYNNGKRVHVVINYAAQSQAIALAGMILKGDLLFMNNVLFSLLGHKKSLALLSEHDESPLYSQRERDMIKKYIPWTREVKPGVVNFEGSGIQLEHLIKSNRRRLVLKAGLSCGGSEVFCGPAHHEDQWYKLVQTAFAQKDWVVQEYLPPLHNVQQFGDRGAIPHSMVWGEFRLGKRYGGTMARILNNKNNSGVVNICQGAEFTVPLVAEPN